MTAVEALVRSLGAQAVQLEELQPTDVRIGPEDRDFLMSEHRNRIDLRPRDSRRQLWTLKPDAWCGTISLPSGRTLYIEPKVGIENLWRLLTWAWDLPDFPPDMKTPHSTAELLEALVEVFARRVEDLLRRGLLRGYVGRHEDLHTIRGRLNLPEQVRRNIVARHRLACDFDEFTTDLPENRILRRALWMTLRAHSWSPRVRPRLDRCERQMDEVALEPEVLRYFDSLIYTRLNEHYRTPLALARMLLEMLSVTHRAGEREMLPLLIGMPRLFERFVQRLLEERLPGDGLTVRWEGESHRLDIDRTVTLRPDLVICRHGEPICIGDAKYKATGWDDETAEIEDARAARNADVYQLLAYCIGYHVRDAVLIYPQRSGRETIRVRTGAEEVRIHSIGIPLTGDAAKFEEACATLVEQVAEIAREATAARAQPAAAPTPPSA